MTLIKTFILFFFVNSILFCSSKKKSTSQATAITKIDHLIEETGFTLSVNLTGLKSGESITIREKTLGSSFDLVFEKNTVLAFLKKFLPDTSISLFDLDLQDISYNLSVVIQPDGQTCKITDPSGTLTSDTTVDATCADNTDPTLSTDIAISASVSGLGDGKNLVLSEINQGTNYLTFTKNSTTTFTKKIKAGTAYGVSVKTQPEGQKCSVNSGSGTSQTDIVIQVVCKNLTIPDVTTFSLSVIVSGLGTGKTLVVRETGLGSTSDLTFTRNLKSTFGTELSLGSNYSVLIHTQPSGQTCSVIAPSGKITTDTLISITCSNNIHFNPIKLALTGSENLADGACGSYTIITKNSDDFEAIVATTVTVNLLGKSSGIYYSDSNCTTPITATTIAANQSSRTIYYKNLESETGITLKITDNSAILTDATKAITSDVYISKLVSGVRSNHFCALLSSGALKCWGDNSSKQFFDDPTYFQSPIPMIAPDISNASSTALGRNSTCIIKDHKLFCRGINGNLNVDSATSVFIDINSSMSLEAVSTGSANVCVLATNGSVWCAGQNFYGVTGVLATGGDISDQAPFAQIPSLDNVSQISLGSDFACALIGSGEDAHKVKCWGCNSWGQLGDGTGDSLTIDNDTGTPVFVTGIGGSGQLQNVVQISTATSTACALLSNGTLNCWGYEGPMGLVGDNHQNFTETAGADRNSPVAVTFQSSKTPTKIVAGMNHFCALMNDASVQCWGSNDFAQIGNGNINRYATPALFDAPIPQNVLNISESVLDISASANSNCALLADNYTVKCWGDNTFNQSGTENIPYHLHPSNIDGISESANLAFIGLSHACAAEKGAGEMKCWGTNESGELGNGQSYAGSIPTAVTGMSNVISMCGGSNHPYTCAVKSDGTLWCWGNNNLNQLGDGTTTTRMTPVQVKKAPSGSSFLDNIVDVKCGTSSACALDGTGQMWCWGRSNQGALGLVAADITGTVDHSYSGVTDVLSTDGIEAGMLLLVRGTDILPRTITEVGVNFITISGGLDAIPSPVTKSITIYDWKSIYAKAVPGITNATKIAHTTYGSCAILSDYSLKCWGDNQFYLLVNASTEYFVEPSPKTITDDGSSTFNEMATSQGSICATVHESSGSLATNDVECWGGIVETPPSKISGLSNVTKLQMTRGGANTCALMEGGIIKCWGENGNGAIGPYPWNQPSPVPLTYLSGLGAINFFKSELNGTGTCIVKSGGGLYCVNNITSSYSMEPLPVTARSVRRGPVDKLFLSGNSNGQPCTLFYFGAKSNYGGVASPFETEHSFTVSADNPDFAFYNNNTCSESVTSLTIPAGQSLIPIYLGNFSGDASSVGSPFVISNDDESIFTDENFDIYLLNDD